MKNLKLFLIFSIFTCSTTFCYAANVTDQFLAGQREAKLMSMFQVIKFPNTDCAATNSRNGTCYTSSECKSRSGTAAGTCASAYGVCCTFVLGCGQSASQNTTYFEASGASAGICSAKICKSSSNICQIRLDFTTFVISGPSTLTTTTVKALFGEVNDQGVSVSSATQCLTDSFSVSGSTSTSVPVLCGTLTGDHIYLDASSNCNLLTFNLGSTGTGSTISTRTWQIKVSQFNCDYSNRAPVGCLQYFFGSNTGTVKSFNFPTYHLANQKQSICVRRERGYCRICWSATASTDFQLSGKSNVAKGVVALSMCCAYKQTGKGTSGFDCLMIPGASNAASNPGAMLPQSICGRSQGLVMSAAGTIATTVCSKRTPFKISFYSDNWENTATANGEALKSAGFRLGYVQTSC